jgi:tRNA(fMet)-specific endonuclease VapC
MSRLLLDTTLLIDAERGDADLDQVILDTDDTAIAAVTVAELLVGVKLATARYRPGRQAYVDDLVSTIPIVDYDTSVAAAHADLLVAVRERGRLRGAHDLIIAATANATGRAVITADVGAFEGLPGVTTKTYR